MKVTLDARGYRVDAMPGLLEHIAELIRDGETEGEHPTWRLEEDR